jgi:hypothetical protein
MKTVRIEKVMYTRTRRRALEVNSYREVKYKLNKKKKKEEEENN